MDFTGIENYYTVTEDAKVISKHTRRNLAGTELKYHKNTSGYLRVELRCGSVKKRCTVHSLVAHFHLGQKAVGMQIRHLDGNKLNNHVSNLKYGTVKENAEDRKIHGTNAQGETAGLSKLTDQQIIEIRNSGLNGKELAIKYSVCETTISRILIGKTWAHVSGKIRKANPRTVYQRAENEFKGSKSALRQARKILNLR